MRRLAYDSACTDGINQKLILLMTNNYWAKIGFYLLSMVFFLLIVCILSWDVPISFAEGSQFVGFKAIFTTKGILIPLICSVLLLYVAGFLLWLRYFTKGTRIGPIEISNLDNENSEVMSFVASYFFPLVSFNVGGSWRHVVVLFLLFVLIGLIYIKSNLYYCNPTLSIFGFHVYKVNGRTSSRKSFCKTVITFRKISSSDKFKYISIDDNTCFAFKI